MVSTCCTFAHDDCVLTHLVLRVDCLTGSAADQPDNEHDDHSDSKMPTSFAPAFVFVCLIRIHAELIELLLQRLQRSPTLPSSPQTTVSCHP